MDGINPKPPALASGPAGPTKGFVRKARMGDPLVRPKPKVKRAMPQPPARILTPVNGQSGSDSATPSRIAAQMQKTSRSGTPIPPPPQRRIQSGGSGFTSPVVAPFQDFPLMLSKRIILDGHRHHVSRFANKDKPMDPRNSEQFTRPVKLHRRDARANGLNGIVVKPDVEMSGTETPEIKEAERQAILKAERAAKREAENALVAPGAPGIQHKKLGSNSKKTEQVYRNDQTEEQKAQSKLRYEEALPWHLEDFDNKSTWVGSYEAALSDTYAMLVQGPDGTFRMMPLEKWYKFTQKNQFKSLSIEEAEMSLKKKVKEPRWFRDSEEAKLKRQVEMENKKMSRGLFLGKWEKGAGGAGMMAPITKQEAPDADDLDFQEDRFADDEENMLFEEDEETKESEARIKRDQLQANIFDLKEEKEYDKQELLEKKERDAEKKLGKRVKKALMKREKNFVYDSESTSNPYTESSDSDSSSSEAQRRKDEDTDKTKASETTLSSPDKRTTDALHKLKSKSGSSFTSGASTPSGRPSKHHQPQSFSRSTSMTNLKRPGSPLASDTSGNESSRKKPKTKGLHGTNTSGSNTLAPPTRTGTPIVSAVGSLSQSASMSAMKRYRAAGSGSDTEGGGGSGGELSDRTKAKKAKITLKLGSRDASPNRSRAASPGVSADGRPSQIGGPPDLASVPTAAEIRAQVPSNGITIANLLAFFRGRVAGPERNKAFTKLMKENARFDKAKKLLFPL